MALHPFLEWFNTAVAGYGYLGIFIVMVVFNLVPFFMPPNWFIAAFIGSAFQQFNPVVVGLSTGLGTSVGRMGVYLLGRGGSRLLSEGHRERLMRVGRILGKNGAVAAFIFAATPLPDDALILSMGMMKYSFRNLFVGYVLGKVISHVVAIYVFKVSGHSLGLILRSEFYGTVAISILSILLVVAAVLIDWEKLLSGRMPDRFKLP